MSFLRNAARRAASSIARSTRTPSTSSSSPSQNQLSSSTGFHAEHLAEAPVGFMHAPLVLGVAGAIPFIALATPLASVFGEYVPTSLFPLETRADAQARYGAVVASFLGGMHWGFASSQFANAGTAITSTTTAAAKEALLLAGPARFVWSVVPSLLAWPALLCSTPYALVGVGATLLTSLGADCAFAAKKLMPRWLMPLRFGLTGVAVISLGLSIPSAFEAQRADESTAREVAKLKMDAPAARRQLLQNKKQLTDVSEKFEKTKLELVSLADKVKDVESAASARQAELRMQNGALTAAEQVLSANCETLKAEREAARLELDAARAKIGTLVAKVTELADAKEIATASDTKPQEDKKPKTE
tara:strand:+ start:3276 stop:4355 length:1080 start_codon:yes stop_codon:yes gene_type:complete